MPIATGTRLGTWKSTMGEASITAQGQIGGSYTNRLDAQKAIVKSGSQGAIVQQADGRFAAYKIDDGAFFDDLNLGESFALNASGKAAGVVDFVGDDGASVQGGQYLQAPIGKDKGEVVYFMRALGNSDKGWKSTLIDPIMGAPNKALQQDEMALLRAKGYTVVIDNTATSEDMKAAFYNPNTAGMVYLGHGGEGDLATYEEHGWLGPEDLNKAEVSKKLKMTYFQACQTTQKEEKWEDVLGSEVYGWSRNATNFDVMLANSGSTFIPSPGDLLNPYVWMGETVAQAVRKHL